MSYYYYICDTISVYRVLVMYKSHRHTNKHLKLCNELVKADVQLTWCKGTLIAFGFEHTNEIKTHSSKVRQKSTLTVSHICEIQSPRCSKNAEACLVWHLLRAICGQSKPLSAPWTQLSAGDGSREQLSQKQEWPLASWQPCRHQWTSGSGTSFAGKKERERQRESEGAAGRKGGGYWTLLSSPFKPSKHLHRFRASLFWRPRKHKLEG